MSPRPGIFWPSTFMLLLLLFVLLFGLVAGLLEGSSINARAASGALREVYEGIGGVAVSDLTGHASYPASPTSESVVTSFEAPTDVLENYGQRIRALITAPTTGNYTFWIASDDGGALYTRSDGATFVAFACGGSDASASTAVSASARSPVPSSKNPVLPSTPRKLKRNTEKPRLEYIW